MVEIPSVAGIVDDDIDATEGLHRRADKAVCEAVRGDGAVDGDCLAARGRDFFGDFVARRFVEIVDDEFDALAGEFECDGTADATAGTGHERDLAGEVAHLTSSR